MKKAFLALLTLTAIPVFATTQWPLEVNAGGATITIYQPQYESFSEVTLVADAAISVTTAADPQPKFGAARLECTVSKDRASNDLIVQTLSVGKMKLPDATDDQLSSYSSAMQEELADQHITFPVDDVRQAVTTQSDNSYDTAPPKILVMKRPAVLVTIDGEPILSDVDGSPLKKVSNTPFFLVNDPSSGNFYLKGGDIWYSAAAVKGEWHQTMNPPLDVVALSEKMQDDEDSVQNAQATDEKEKTGKIPEIVMSTEPAELIATDGEPAFSPIKKTPASKAAASRACPASSARRATCRAFARRPRRRSRPRAAVGRAAGHDRIGTTAQAREGKLANGPRLCFERDQRPFRSRLGPGPRFQRAAVMASRDRREPDRNGEPADKIGCVRLPPAQRRPHPGKLLGLSDFELFCTYSILESPMGVENYVATLRLTPVSDGDRTFAEWTAEFDCAPEREAELIAGIGGGVFQGGFDALKRQFGG